MVLILALKFLISFCIVLFALISLSRERECTMQKQQIEYKDEIIARQWDKIDSLERENQMLQFYLERGGDT